LILRGNSGDARLIAALGLAGKSTLNRLELRSDDPARDGRYKKIALDEQKVDDFFIDIFVQAHKEAPKLIIIDLDSTPGSGRDRDGAGAVLNDSVETAQDWGASAGHGAASCGAAGEQLSISGIVSGDLSPAAGNGADALLRWSRDRFTTQCLLDWNGD
jgi:hypothetical protein